MAKNILWLDEVDRGDISEVGGKGANLGELAKAKITVPETFFISAGAYYRLIKERRLDRLIKKLLARLDPENTKALNLASREIQKALQSQPFSTDLESDILEAYGKLGVIVSQKNPLVAVRSSATAEDLSNASFAGLQSTYLNISGEKALLEAVKDVIGSLFTPRAIYYRTINSFSHLKVALCTAVQKMIQADRSGILFTNDPVFGDDSVMVIDAILGLGEAIVSGSVTPDHFVVEKGSLKIIDKQIARQAWQMVYARGKNIHRSLSEKEKARQKITDHELIELARLGKQIENHYQSPQDCEWAIEKGKIFFVQARPVTTDKKPPKIVPIHVVKDGQNTLARPGALGEELLSGIAASVGIASGTVNIIANIKAIESFEPDSVLVAEMTNPSFVPALRKAAAIVTDSGGMTSHAAIVARELGIPCVVGTGQATHRLKEGQMVTVDGAKGLVYKGKVDKAALKNDHIQTSQNPFPSEFIEEVPITATKVYVNLAEPDRAQEAAKLPCDGVGLLRAEFMIAQTGEHPKALLESGKGKKFVANLVEGLNDIASAFKPRPVVYRATDFKTNEYRSLKGGEKYEPKEENPMLGWRGALRYIQEPALFALELEALKTVREKYHCRNLHLMIPFVRTLEEIENVKTMLAAAGLKNDGKDFKLWIMVEVPSTVLLIDKFCSAGVDGVSIGSNDLTQLILGVDRDNGALAESFDERDPAVIMALERVVAIARKMGVASSICGSAPSVYPEVTEAVVRAGITSVSVAPDAVVATKKLIASIEKRILLEKH